MIDQLRELAEAQPFDPFTIVVRTCERVTSTTFAAPETSSSRTSVVRRSGAQARAKSLATPRQAQALAHPRCGRNC